MASLPDEQQYEEILCFDTGENIIHHVPISQATRETGKALSAFGDRPDDSKITASILEVKRPQLSPQLKIPSKLKTAPPSNLNPLPVLQQLRIS
jgi:hypothetical protein